MTSTNEDVELQEVNININDVPKEIKKEKKKEKLENEDYYLTEYLKKVYGEEYLIKLKTFYKDKYKADLVPINLLKEKKKLMKKYGKSSFIMNQVMQQNSSEEKTKLNKLNKRIENLTKKYDKQKTEKIFEITNDYFKLTQKNKEIHNINRKKIIPLTTAISNMKESIKNKEQSIFIDKYDFLFDYTNLDSPVEYFEEKMSDYDNAIKKYELYKNHENVKNQYFIDKEEEIKVSMSNLKELLKKETDKKERKVLMDSYGKYIKMKYELHKEKTIMDMFNEVPVN